MHAIQNCWSVSSGGGFLKEAHRGTIVVAALRDGILVVRPDETHEFLALDGPLITNVAFGGADRRTAYITESAIGSLVSIEWPRPGLELEFNTQP